MTNKLPHFKGMTDEDEAVLRGAIVRMNASDVERFNEYERRIADLERHNELLRAVAGAAMAITYVPCGLTFTVKGKLNFDEKCQAAIDGGALEVE